MTTPTPAGDGQTKPRLDLFPTVRVAGVSGSAVFPAEMVTPSIAITPAIDMQHGRHALGGGFVITHVASGRVLTGQQACLACAREVAGRLTRMAIDWDALDLSDAAALKASLGEHYESLITALRLINQCAQQLCSQDPDPCDACGGVRQHAQYCMHVVVPMVARNNAAS